MNNVKNVLIIVSIFFLSLSLIMFFYYDLEAKNLLRNFIINDKFIILNDNDIKYINNNKIFTNVSNEESKENNIIIDKIIDENIEKKEEALTKEKEQINRKEQIVEELSDSKNSNLNQDENIEKSSNTKNLSFSNSNRSQEVKEKTNEIKDNIKPELINTSTKNKSNKEKELSNLSNFDKSSIDTIYKGGFYTIQIASFKDFKNAILLKKELEKKGYYSFIVIKLLDNIYYFRVNIGIFADKESALSYYKNKLKLDKYFKPFIIYYPKNYFK
ncbi:MAG: SPOR domain-containing protein [Spirochaetes bacterium]|nr:SPOR domain-containing protein [Spirochaetota bacterium]